MGVVIRFNSSVFDLASEPTNPINPIPGVSILTWLRSRVPAEFRMTEPNAEDWGWYSNVHCNGRSYLIGASATEESDGNHEWAVQIDAQRSLKEKLLGRGKMSPDDSCALSIEQSLRSQAEFTNVQIERDV
jgi:hypothetical protein